MPVANRSILAGLGVLLALGPAAQGALAAPSGPPVRIGSTLALTGPLAATGLVHKIVGEIYVEHLNRKTACSAAPWNGCSRTTSRGPTSRARSTSSSSPSTRST